MKNYRNAAAALALALILCTSAFAGEMHTNAPSPPPAPTPAAHSVIQAGATDGETQTGDAVYVPEAPDTLTGIALNLLQSVLSLF